MSQVQLWKSNSDIVIRDTDRIEDVVGVAKQLKRNDQRQLISAFDSGNYQMLSTYIWSKTITTLKSQLTNMGSAFVGEMLDRPDINESSNLQQTITEFETIKLSENLGLISSKSAFRLKHAMDLLAFFNNPDDDEDDVPGFRKLDAQQVILACIESVLGHDRIELRIDFRDFRNSLEEQELSIDSPNIQKLIKSPPFFKSATIRMLLSSIKSKTGAQLENSLSNTNLILPEIWNEIRQPERWQVGRCYAEMFNEGKTTAVSGLKQALLKVRGFDYVPEDLRSTSFIKAATDLIKAHEGNNNYYSEPSYTKTLKEMGTVVPMPAFPSCMTAVLSVKIGNYYGYSWEAQSHANAILSNLNQEKWSYYFEECLPGDDRILNKLTQDKPTTRWVEMIKGNEQIEDILESIKNPNVKQLLQASLKGRLSSISQQANKIKSELGLNP